MKINIHFGTAGIILDADLEQTENGWCCYVDVGDTRISGSGKESDDAIKDFKTEFLTVALNS
jgi:hypothetical protein